MKLKASRLVALLLVIALILSPFQASTVLAAMTEDELAQVPGAEVVVADILGGTLKDGSEAYGEMTTVDVEGQPFAKALRFSNHTQPGVPQDFQYEVPITGEIAQGDVLLATFYARTISSTHETAEGSTTFVLERMATWNQSVKETMALPSTWKKFYIPVTSIVLMENGMGHITFRLGYKPQVVEIGGLQVVNYKKAVTFADLPSTPVTYPGMEEDAPWREQAFADIEKYRKGDLEVKVVDSNGTPIPDADVHVEMTKHAFKFGTAVNSSYILGTDATSQKYRDMLKENFNSVVMENEMKWAWWEQDRARTVNMYNWLAENGFDIRGHALLWDGPTRMPTDIGTIIDDRAVLDKRIQDHFHELAGYFRGRLYNWDVLNEPVLNSMIRSKYGEAIIADWFKLAKEADPNAKLYVNETQILGVDAPVIGQFSGLLQVLKDNNAPLDGIGIQAHFGSTPVDPMAFYRQLTHFAQYAPEIAITEFDFNTAKEDIQGQFTRDLLIAVFSHPNVTSFTMWGFWDGAHWQNNAPLFRNDWSLKPSGVEWRKLIYDTWWTDVTGKTNTEGVYATRGFYGDYDITVSIGGTDQTVKASLEKDANNQVTVVWGQPSDNTGDTFTPLAVPAQDAEITAPVWPYGSVFSVSEASPTSVTLAWPAAHDNQAVSSYTIYQDGNPIGQVPANVTFYDVTELTPDQSYSFTVEAKDSQGNRSLRSPVIQAMTTSGTDFTLPGWQKGSFLTVSDLSQTGIKLSWPAAVDNDGAESYRIYVNGQIVGDTDKLNYTVAGLTENHLYTVRVEAKDPEGNLSQNGPIVTFRTLGVEDTTAPVWPSPSELTATETTKSSTLLNWNAALDAKGVQSYRVYEGGQEWVTLPATATSYRVDGLSANTAYTFKVEAVDSSNNWSEIGPSVTVKTLADADVAAPIWPLGRMLTYSMLTDKSVSLNWTAATDNIEVTGYKVYSNGTEIAALSANETSFVATGLTPGASYDFEVQAGDASGNWSTDGPVVQVKTYAAMTRHAFKLSPSDDAFIQAPTTLGGDGTTNNLDYLRFKNAAGVSGSDQNKNTGNNRRAYLKFPLSTVTGNVYEAKLNVYVYAVQTANMDISMDLYATEDAWTETTINWKNKPADGVKLESTIARNQGYWKTFTVTDYAAAEANGDQWISFKLTDDSWKDQNVDMYAKDSANVALRPYLEVGTEEMPVDTDQPTWTAGALTVTNVKPHAATLTWSGAADEQGINQYVIYQDGVPVAEIGSDVTSFEVTGLAPETAYAFKVEAKDGAQETADGPAGNVTTPTADTAAPAWPTGAALTAQDVSRFTVDLTWTAAEDDYDVKEYAVYSGSTLLATVPGHMNTYRVSGLTAGTAYTFGIVARDTAGNESVKLTVDAGTLAADSSKPAWNDGSTLAATQVSTAGVMLTWPAAQDDTAIHQYRIYKDDALAVTLKKEVTGYYVAGLTEDTLYKFAVYAEDAAGNVSEPLALDSFRTLKLDTITPQWPTGSRITAALETDQAVLSWDAAVDNIGVQSYLIYRNGVLTATVGGNRTTHALPGEPDPSAVYKIEAVDAAGNTTVFGPSSNDAEQTVPHDTTAPAWPQGSALTASAKMTTSIALTWNEAIDRMGVKEYKLYMNGNVIATTTGTSWTATGLAASTSYAFKVEAGDEAGNWSTNGPTLTTSTSSTSSSNPPVTVIPAEDGKQPTVEVDNGKVHVKVSKDQVIVENGKVKVEIKKDVLSQAIKDAAKQAANGAKVSIVLPETAEAKAFNIEIPAEFLTNKDKKNFIELQTGLGSLVLPSNMLANNSSLAEQDLVTIRLTAAELPQQSKVRGVAKTTVDLQVLLGDQTLAFHNPNAAVQVRIPQPLGNEERLNTELLNVWYIDDQGKAILVPSGRYDLASGEMTFTTDHFSTYAIVYGKGSFADLSKAPWAKQAIEALAAKGIINGVSESLFNPQASVTRADFTKLLVDTLGLTAEFTAVFSDVKATDYYYEAVGIAHKLGIASGKDATHFAPKQTITRQEMFTMIANALALTSKPLPAAPQETIAGFADQEQVAGYARDAMASLVKQGFVKGADSKLDPRKSSSRAEAAAMLHRVFNYIFE